MKNTERRLLKQQSGLIREATAEERANARRMHESNRVAWNQGALRYREELPEAIDFIRAGKMNLLPAELDHLGDLRGQCRRAIHLQCASGRDTLSLWTLGAAEVVGVDISDLHIENAHRLSEAVGAPARWYRCDVLDVPHELDASADLVYTGKGALCWLQDLRGWSEVVARLLAPGGRVYIYDTHPITWLFDLDADDWTYAGYDYFGKEVEASKGWAPQYIGALDRPDRDLAWKYERLWTMSDIIQSLIDAGLGIVRFTEHPDDYWDAFPHIPPEIRRRVPLTFSLLALRPI